MKFQLAIDLLPMLITHHREGLEKMEREKLKQAERDREMKERDEKRRQEKLFEQNLLMQFNTNDSSPMLPAKSKFVCKTFFNPFKSLIVFFFFFSLSNSDSMTKKKSIQ